MDMTMTAIKTAAVTGKALEPIPTAIGTGIQTQDSVGPKGRLACMELEDNEWLVTWENAWDEDETFPTFAAALDDFTNRLKVT